jgi:hypothetical protein
MDEENKRQKEYQDARSEKYYHDLNLSRLSKIKLNTRYRNFFGFIVHLHFRSILPARILGHILM